MSEKPIRIPVKHWRSRWLTLLSGRVLHRILSIKWGVSGNWGEPEEMLDGTGIAVCGASGDFMMPGILSRLGEPRCQRCCRRLGIPAGLGAPFNDKALTRKQQGV